MGSTKKCKKCGSTNMKFERKEHLYFDVFYAKCLDCGHKSEHKKYSGVKTMKLRT